RCRTMAQRERLRVALVSVSCGEYCMRLANALSAYADVLLLMPERVVRPFAPKLDGTVRLFSYQSPRLRQPLSQFRTIRTVMREIRAFSPDLIHYQGFHLWFDLALAAWRRYPLVFTVHDFRAHPGDTLTQKTPFWLEMLARRSADQAFPAKMRSEEHTSELQSRGHLVCRLLLEKKKKKKINKIYQLDEHLMNV